MRKSRFTESQIVSILHELDAGATAKELGRRHGVHPNTITAWRTKYHGMEASDVVHLRQLEDENARLKRVVANLTLENDAIKDLLSKNFPGPQHAKKR
jgi:putative transposase